MMNWIKLDFTTDLKTDAPVYRVLVVLRDRRLVTCRVFRRNEARVLLKSVGEVRKTLKTLSFRAKIQAKIEAKIQLAPQKSNQHPESVYTNLFQNFFQLYRFIYKVNQQERILNIIKSECI